MVGMISANEITDPALLGHTDREIYWRRDVEDASRSAFAHIWRLIFDGSGDVERLCDLYDAIEKSSAANAHIILIDHVTGSHFIALTDCPMAYLKMLAGGLGIRDIASVVDVLDNYDDYHEDANALDRGDVAPNAIVPSWHPARRP